MKFTEAVAVMLTGKKVSRPRKYRDPEAHYINPTATKDHPAFLINEGGVVSPWLPTLADMEADDWSIYVAPEPGPELDLSHRRASTRLLK